MIRYKKAIEGNRFEVIKARNSFLLQDNTLQQIIAEANNIDELVIYAEKNNMISADAIII